MRLYNFRTLTIFVFVLSAAWLVPATHGQAPASQVLFVCEHGNVKSLMAVSYFNQLATQRGLHVRAVSRGTAPDSTTVPLAIIQGLRGDGFDVSGFHPSTVKPSDAVSSQRVVTIGVILPPDVQVAAKTKPDQWNDVPAASVDYAAARDSLKAHVKQLIDQLAAN